MNNEAARQGSFAGAGRAPKSGLSKSWRCATMSGCFIALIALVGSLNYYYSLLLLSRPSAKHPDFPIPSCSLQGRRVKNSKGGEPCNPRHARGSTTEATATVKLAICAIVKDEAPYLAEWIEHHKSIGFDFILLYNDKSADDTQCVLDAYARRGDVTRVPEDIGNSYMEDLPWIHEGQIPNNPQQAIFEACRRYLVDEERSSGEAGSTWMLTNDVDEFLWFDRDFGNVMNSLATMLLEFSSEQPKSIVVPTCMFGHSGKESFEPEPVMRRFVHRDNNTDCAAKRREGLWATVGKAFSHVSSIATFTRPEEHVVLGGSILRDVTKVGAYMRLAHYKTKSRESSTRASVTAGILSNTSMGNLASGKRAQNTSSALSMRSSSMKTI